MSLAVALLVAGSTLSVTPPTPSIPLIPLTPPAGTVLQLPGGPSAASVPPTAPPPPVITGSRIVRHGYQQQSVCNQADLQRVADSLGASFERLGDLPMGVQQLAVLRQVGTCSIATVKMDGRTYWVPLERTGGIMPLDARSRRR
jgi:hypothetical protein